MRRKKHDITSYQNVCYSPYRRPFYLHFMAAHYAHYSMRQYQDNEMESLRKGPSQPAAKKRFIVISFRKLQEIAHFKMEIIEISQATHPRILHNRIHAHSNNSPVGCTLITPLFFHHSFNHSSGLSFL
jgi:hypothetical protein